MAETMRPAETTELGVGPLVPPQLPLAGEEDFEIQLESLNQWQLAWRRFKRHRLALIGSVAFGLIVLIAIVAPILWPYDVTDIPGAKTDRGVSRGSRWIDRRILRRHDRRLPHAFRRSVAGDPLPVRHPCGGALLRRRRRGHPDPHLRPAVVAGLGSPGTSHVLVAA